MKTFGVIKMRWVVWVWNHTPNCAEMSRLSSRSLEHPQSLKLRGQMWLHFLICTWCQRYFRQLNFLHEAASRFEEHFAALPDHGLSAEARRRIIQRLQFVEMKGL